MRAKVKYLASANEDNTAVYHASQAGDKEVGKHEGQFVYHEVTVNDGRESFWDLDRQGFQLIQQPTKVTDFYDDGVVRSVFYQEAEDALLRHVPGAKHVKIFDHTRRSSAPQQRQSLRSREPSSIIHNDYTAKSATKRLHDMMPTEEIDALLSRNDRFAIVNLWRSISGRPVQTAPLVFCDSTTIDVAKDLISVKRVAKDRIGEVQDRHVGQR